MGALGQPPIVRKLPRRWRRALRPLLLLPLAVPLAFVEVSSAIVVAVVFVLEMAWVVSHRQQRARLQNAVDTINLWREDASLFTELEAIERGGWAHPALAAAARLSRAVATQRTGEIALACTLLASMDEAGWGDANPDARVASRFALAQSQNAFAFGDVVASASWLERARAHAGRRHAYLCMEALLASRRGAHDEVLALRSAISGPGDPESRWISVLVAFALASAGDEAGAASYLVGLRPVRRHEFTGLAWPELRRFLDHHHLV